jgi:hypothetical protein
MSCGQSPQPPPKAWRQAQAPTSPSPHLPSTNTFSMTMPYIFASICQYYQYQPLNITIIKRGKSMFKRKFKDAVTTEEQNLINEIKLTKNAIQAAYSNFENAVEPDLIDCYIYQLNSEQKRYKYLIELAKQTQCQNKLPC